MTVQVLTTENRFVRPVTASLSSVHPTLAIGVTIAFLDVGLV